MIELEIDFTKRRFLEFFFIHNSENSINDKKNCFYYSRDAAETFVHINSPAVTKK